MNSFKSPKQPTWMEDFADMNKAELVDENEGKPKPGEVVKRAKRRVVDRVTSARRMAFIERLVIEGVSVAKICALAKRPLMPTDDRPAGLGIGAQLTQILIGKVRERMVIESDAMRGTNKAAQEQRLYDHIRTAKALKRIGDVARFEGLLAEVQGTKEPVRIEMNVQMRSAVIHVLGSMREHEMDELLADYQDMKRKAAMVEATIDVEPKLPVKKQ